MTQTSPSPRLPWYYIPMVVLVAGCIVAIINFGIRSTFGQFTLPISQEFGWPRETYSLAIAIQNLLWGIATPIAGMLADRYGSARVLIAGAVIYALGIVGMSYSDIPVLLHATAGILVGIGVALSSFSIVMAALGRIVPPEKRSWAFGLATASGSLGQFIFSPLVGAMIAAYGWHSALLALAASALLIIPFALPLMVQNTSSSKAAKGETELSMTEAISKAFGHGSYLLLVAGFFVCGFQLAFVTVHLPPYLAEHGLSKEFAGIAMSLIGLFNVVGSYTAGIIGGRERKRFPLSAIYILRSIAIIAFIMLPITQTSTLIFTAVLGFLWLSTIPFTMGLVIVMFGTRYMATLYGFVFLSHQVGSFLGVWLGGKLYDVYGSYDIVWWMCVGLGVFAALVNLPIKEKPAASFAAV
jgi:predicted MFS family arabinose efflux permease